MRTLVIFLCSMVGVCLGNTSCNVAGATVQQIVENPDPNWNFDCLDEKLMNEFISSRRHVEEVVNCLSFANPCSKPGYELIAGEILDRVGSGAQCFNCSPRLEKIVQAAVRRLQQEQTDLFRKGLAYLS